jgi:Tol biopolymer transport system component
MLFGRRTEHLLFLGNPDERLLREGGLDWYVTPLAPGPAIKTGALESTRKANLAGPAPVNRLMLSAPVWQPQGDALIFSAHSGDSTNLWRIGISPKTWKITGPPERLTAGSAEELNPSVASGPGGIVRLAFASVTGNSGIWNLPIEPNQGRATGALKGLTQETAADFQPALSKDGNKMAWVSARSGTQEIWIRDLRTGEDSALTASHSDKMRPRFSPDGAKVSFSSHEDNKWNNIYIMPVVGGKADWVCQDCGLAMDWSPDGKRIVGTRLGGQGAWVVDVASRRKSDLFASDHWMLPWSFSPDGGWLSFSDGRSLRNYIAPVDNVPVPESAWILTDTVAPAWGNDGAVQAWAPNGSLFYTVSDREGYACIWAQRLDPATKRSVGLPFAVFHSHSVQLSLVGSKLDVAGGRMVFDMVERTGNIWMAEWKER